MANLFGLPTFNPFILGTFSAVAKSGLALNDSMVFNTSGTSVAFRFMASASVTLDDVYVFITASNGTPGNLTFELRNQNTNLRPGTTVHASGNVTWPAANKWCKWSPGYAMTAGVTYWLVLSNGDGTPATNYPTVAYSGGASGFSSAFNFIAPFRATAGWSASGTGTGNSSPVVLKLSDGTYLGSQLSSASTNYTSNTLERGVKILGLDADIKIAGVASPALSSVSAFRIMAGATAPGGSPIYSYSLTADNRNNTSFRIPPQTLTRGTIYRLTYTFSAGSTSPAYVINEDYATEAATANAAFAGGQAIATIDDGAGGWTDSVDRFPLMGIVIDSMPAPAASGAVAVVSAIG